MSAELDDLDLIEKKNHPESSFNILSTKHGSSVEKSSMGKCYFDSC